MASIRNLKKDIHFLASELVTEAYVKQYLKEDVDQDKLAQVMVAAIDFQSTLISRANHPDGKDNPKLVKAYFSTLRKEMMANFLKISEEINAL